jgi:hypothetical protein
MTGTREGSFTFENPHSLQLQGGRIDARIGSRLLDRRFVPDAQFDELLRKSGRISGLCS